MFMRGVSDSKAHKGGGQDGTNRSGSVRWYRQWTARHKGSFCSRRGDTANEEVQRVVGHVEKRCK